MGMNHKPFKKLIPMAMAGTLMISSLSPAVTQASDPLIPLRAALESEGASLIWDQESKTVSFTLKNGLTGSVQIGSEEYQLSGFRAKLPAAVELKNGRTRVPQELVEVLKSKDLAQFVVHQSGYKTKVLTEEGQILSDGGETGVNFDLNAYVPIEGEKEGWLYTSNETRPGGGFLQRIQQDSDGFYRVLESKRIQFDQVGGTWNNCSGNITPWGTILSGEEYAPQSTDDSRFQQAIQTARNQGITFSEDPLNFGMVVEIDPQTGKVTKHRSLGRFSHESAIVLPDEKTAFTTDDTRGGIFAKFVADQEQDLSKGTLYAAKFDRENQKVDWIEIPDDHLNDARSYAISQGATGFDRPEDMEYNPVDGMVYWVETGDNKKAGKLKYGRIYQLNPQTNEMKVFAEGGPDSFANPDNLAIHPVTGDLYVHEDNYGEFMLPTIGQDNNAMWKVSLTDRKVEKFASVAYGAEITGGTFSPDGKVMFVNMQHPASPNKNQIIMIRGF